MKIKMPLEKEPIRFQYGKESYVLSVVPIDSIPILPQPIRFPAMNAIHIHKIRQNGLVSDYYIPRSFSRKRSNYFQLSKCDFLRFKPQNNLGEAYEVTFFENPNSEATDYALFLSQESTNPLDNTFGIRSVNDKSHEISHNVQIFACEEGTFELFKQAENFAVDYQYYVQTIALLNALLQDGTDGVLPNAPRGMTIGAITSFSSESNTYFNGEDYAIITAKKPEFACFKQHSTITVTTAKLEHKKPFAIDLYLFDASDDTVAKTYYEEAPRFMGFKGSNYTVSYLTNPNYPTSIITIHKESETILEQQLDYTLDFKRGLEGLDSDMKKQIHDLIVKS